MKFISLLPLLILLSCGSPQSNPAPEAAEQDAAVSAQKTIGHLVKLDPAFDQIVSADAQIEVIGEGYSWSEGPVWLPAEQSVIWSDVPENVIYSWKEGGAAEVYLKPAGHTGEGRREGSNGLLLDANGDLVICQHGDRRMARMNAPLNAPQPNFETLADKFDGKRFNSPNDAAYDQDGYLYFTDPPYGLPEQENDPEKEIPFQGVYRLSPDGTVSLLTDELSRPNGIAFNPDFTKCYVANSDHERAIWMVYDLTEDKTFANGKVFFDATDMVPDTKGLPDGLKVRKDGTVFATGPGGVFVFTPEGKHLGTIAPGEATANCAFNADETVLFMTAHSYMTKIDLK